MKHLGLATLLVTLAASTTVIAQPPGGGRGPGSGPDAMLERILSFDDNEDGKLSKEEIPERLQSMFARADKNKDGQLTKEEIRADLQNRDGQERRGGRQTMARAGTARPAAHSNDDRDDTATAPGDSPASRRQRGTWDSP